MDELTKRSFRFENGSVYLYQRPNTRAWWTRQRRPDGSGWTRFSTGCDVFEDAISAALKAHQEAVFRHRFGLTPTSRTFRDAAEAVMERLRADAVKRKRDEQYVQNAVNYLERYAIGFFADRSIDEISTPDIAAFRNWREAYWETGPGKDEIQTIRGKDGKTIRRRTRHGRNPASGEWSWLRSVFDHAVEKGWLSKERVPEIKATTVKGKRRPYISDQELEKIGYVALDWIEQGRGGVHERVRWLTTAFVAALLHTGMRTGEAVNLKWKDVDRTTVSGVSYLYLKVDGKTGPRTVVPIPGMKSWLEDIKQQHPDPSPDQPIFATADHLGKVYQPSFAKPFASLLAYAKVTHDSHGDRFTLYCLRHTYATARLREGHVDAHTLARAMGTSTAMMDRHYSHITAILAAERLTKRTWPKDDDDEDEDENEDAAAG